MNTILYDGSFEGFLTVIFEIFEHKLSPEKIQCTQKHQPRIFEELYETNTIEVKAKRVWKGLSKKLSKDGQKMVYYTFLSAQENVEMLLYRFIYKVLNSAKNIEQDFGDRDVLEVWQTTKKVAHEVHRVLMFVRFQKTADDIFYASFDPQYDILHLSINHFKNRFADQKWVIYDTKRDYGYYYNLTSVSDIHFTDSTINYETGRLKEEAMASDELVFQKLWKIYFTEIAIKERKNLRQQRQFMPKRYWKYLVEKW
jgi:probable DNA metabolism protein